MFCCFLAIHFCCHYSLLRSVTILWWSVNFQPCVKAATILNNNLSLLLRSWALIFFFAVAHPSFLSHHCNLIFHIVPLHASHLHDAPLHTHHLCCPVTSSSSSAPTHVHLRCPSHLHQSRPPVSSSSLSRYRAVVVLDDNQRAVIKRTCVEWWLGDMYYPTDVVSQWGGIYGLTLPAGRGGLRLLCGGASNTLMGLFHVAFCGGWAQVEIARDSFCWEFGHPSRKPCRIALRSVEILGLHVDWCTNFDAVGLGSDGVCEETQFIWCGVWLRVFHCLFCFVGLGSSTPGDG